MVQQKKGNFSFFSNYQERNCKALKHINQTYLRLLLSPVLNNFCNLHRIA